MGRGGGEAEVDEGGDDGRSAGLLKRINRDVEWKWKAVRG